MPLNLPSHAHGQGYSDMNIVIPELVDRVNYQKGPYYVEDGDFSSAAAAHLNFFTTLPQSLAIVEGGITVSPRAVFASSEKAGAGNILYGVEAYHDDGPWIRPDDYQKFNGMLTYSLGDPVNGFSVTARGYHGKWNSSDQIAESAVSAGLVPFFGSLNPTDGGNSQRYSLQAEWHRADEESDSKVMAYGFYYDLDLFSDFSYFLTDTNRGDQFEQKDHRIVAGINVSHTFFSHWAGREMENTFGLQARNDWINNGIYQTQARQRVDKIDSATGALLSATTRQDRLSQTALGLYYENKIQWAEKFRAVAGVRGDIYNFNVTDANPVNSGNDLEAVGSPKLSLIFGPWARTEVYVNGGFGFHSNDGRATTTTTNADGTFIGGRAPGLAQTKGAEIGARTLIVPKLQSTLSFWYLHSDLGIALPRRFRRHHRHAPTQQPPWDRMGELFTAPTDWLTLDADCAVSASALREPDSDGGTRVPEAINQVLAAGVTLHDARGFSAGLRLRITIWPARSDFHRQCPLGGNPAPESAAGI